MLGSSLQAQLICLTGDVRALLIRVAEVFPHTVQDHDGPGGVRPLPAHARAERGAGERAPAAIACDWRRRDPRHPSLSRALVPSPLPPMVHSGAVWRRLSHVLALGLEARWVGSQ